MNYWDFTRENARNVPCGGRTMSRADTEAGDLTELDFHKIIEIRIFIYDSFLSK